MNLDSYSIDLDSFAYSVSITKGIDNTKYKSDKLLILIDNLHDYLGFPFILFKLRLVSKEYNYNCCYFIYDYISIDSKYIDSLINIQVSNYITKYTIECAFNKIMLKLCFHMYAYNNDIELLNFIQNPNNFETIFDIYSFPLQQIRNIFNHRKYLFIKAVKRNAVLLFNEFILFQLNSNIFENCTEMNSKSASQIIIYTIVNKIYHKHLYVKNINKKSQIINRFNISNDIIEIDNLFKNIQITKLNNKLNDIPIYVLEYIYEYLGVQGCVLLASTNKSYYNEIVNNVIYKLNIVKDVQEYLNLDSIYMYKNKFINTFKLIRCVYKYNNSTKIYIKEGTEANNYINPDKIKLLKLKKTSPKLDYFMMNFITIGDYTKIKNRCCGINSHNKRCLVQCKLKDKYCKYHKNQVTDIISKPIFSFLKKS